VSDLAGVAADLAAEQASLDVLVADLGDDRFHMATPSPGWDVADQIGHLAYFDHAAALALSDPGAFAASVEALVAAALEGGLDEATLGPTRARLPRETLAEWRAARTELLDAAAGADPSARVPWYGPSMNPVTFLRARLMEAWAHGVDVEDALGVRRAPSDRLRHVAELGLRTRTWSYRVRGEEPPPGEVALELTAPSGEIWRLGPEGADDVVRGPALDLCLVVVQRRHVEDTALVAGELGRHWLERAQAFAGGPTEGPAPGSRGVAG
jgi:uncharacterized protein (TIGR03084 family)